MMCDCPTVGCLTLSCSHRVKHKASSQVSVCGFVDHLTAAICGPSSYSLVNHILCREDDLTHTLINADVGGPRPSLAHPHHLLKHILYQS